MEYTPSYKLTIRSTLSHLIFWMIFTGFVIGSMGALIRGYTAIPFHRIAIVLAIIMIITTLLNHLYHKKKNIQYNFEESKIITDTTEIHSDKINSFEVNPNLFFIWSDKLIQIDTDSTTYYLRLVPEEAINELSKYES